MILGLNSHAFKPYIGTVRKLLDKFFQISKLIVIPKLAMKSMFLVPQSLNMDGVSHTPSLQSERCIYAGLANHPY